MITRRQAKLKRLAATQEPSAPSPASPPPTVTSDALCDASLELVFTFLDPADLVRASQVCRRWSDVCSSRRVWAFRTLLSVFYNDNTDELYRVVRLLRRTRGIFPYSKVSILTGTSSVFDRVYFKENGDRLIVDTSSALLVLLSLRNLVKDNVTELEFAEKLDLFTQSEALILWEILASKTQLQHLDICLHGKSSMLEDRFQWPKRGALTHLTFNCVNSSHRVHLCRPIGSLLQLHRDQLTWIDMRPESQQALLKFRPTRLRHLQAVLVPGLLDTLMTVPSLEKLCLHGDSKDPAVSLRVLRNLLSWRKLQQSLVQLKITFSLGVGSSDSEQLLKLLASFRHLLFVRLKGLCSALADPMCGTTTLESLLSGMPCVKNLMLDVEPCAIPLQGLLPCTSADGSKVRRVPDCLRFLVLMNPEASDCIACDSKWLHLLRRVMDDSPNLHVIVEGRCLQMRNFPAGQRGKIYRSRIVLLPHPADSYCQACPDPKIMKEKGYMSMYIGELSCQGQD